MTDERFNIDPETIDVVERFRRSHDTAVLVIMFVDMVDSTSRREAMGEIRFELVGRRTDEILRGVLVQDSHGVLLKSTGDRQLLLFTEPGQAVKRALVSKEWASPFRSRMPIVLRVRRRGRRNPEAANCMLVLF